MRNLEIMNYPVHEIFNTWQGEGEHMGRHAFFVRLYGCPVHCPWCDSAGTWHPKHVPKDIQRMSPNDIAHQAMNDDAKLVVITGGEPCIHDLGLLCAALHEKNMRVHLETSGAFPIRGMLDWITLSPKKWKPPLEECVEEANEFKIIVEEPDDIHLYLGMLLERGFEPGDGRSVWLHPEWSQRSNAAVLSAISTTVKGSADRNLRAGYQLHKVYDVDRLDERSRRLVPLGGDPAKGF